MESLSPAQATRQLFERYGDEVYRYLRYTLGARSEAEDLVQEVFVRVLQGWDRFEHRSQAQTWLWAIANNCVRDQLRKRQRHAHTVPLDDTAHSTVSDMDLFLQLEQSLQVLTLPQRQVFVARVIHEQSTAETATALGWSEAKVRTTLHRAMKEVRRAFADDVAEGADDDERAR